MQSNFLLCVYSECLLNVFMQNVILSVIMLNVIILNVVVLCCGTMLMLSLLPVFTVLHRLYLGHDYLTCINFFFSEKQPVLFRRSTVLCLSFQSVFPGLAVTSVDFLACCRGMSLE
jgi:hypothetical protein